MSKAANIVKFGILSNSLSINSKIIDGINKSQSGYLAQISFGRKKGFKPWFKKNEDHLSEKLIIQDNFESVVKSDVIDCLYLALNTPKKFEWAKQAVENGKHILVEKPLMGKKDTKDLQQLLEICKKNERVFMDSTMWVNSQRIQDIQNKLADKEMIGQVSKVNAAFSYNASQQHFKDYKEPLGVLGELGWHASYAALYGFGFEVPERVQAVNWKFNGKILSECYGIIYYSGGRIAYIGGSFEEPIRQSLEIIGQSGTIQMENFQNRDNQSSSQYYESKNGYKHTVEVDDVSGSMESVINNFTEQIEQGNNDQIWGQRSLLNQQILVHLNQSVLKKGKIIQFDNKL